MLLLWYWKLSTFASHLLARTDSKERRSETMSILVSSLQRYKIHPTTRNLNLHDRVVVVQRYTTFKEEGRRR